MGRDIVWFDIESTGTNTNIDRIVELSMIKISGGNIIKNIVHRYDPEMPIPTEASLIHKIFDVDVLDQPTFGSMVPMILEFIKDCDLAGYNIMGFDIKILFNEISRAGYSWDYSEHRFLDTFFVYRKMFPGSLSDVYKKLTDKDLQDAHSAQADVVASMEVMKILQEKHGAPVDVDVLHDISTNGSKMLDLSGKFKYNDKGQVIFNFGTKHYGEVVGEKEKHGSYLQWILDPNNGFSEDVKMVCRKLIKKQL